MQLFVDDAVFSAPKFVFIRVSSLSTNMTYHIAGNIRRVQFSRVGKFSTFRGFNFYGCTLICTYERAYFVGLIVTVSQSTAKLMVQSPNQICPVCFSVLPV